MSALSYRAFWKRLDELARPEAQRRLEALGWTLVEARAHHWMAKRKGTDFCELALSADELIEKVERAERRRRQPWLEDEDV